MGTRFNAIAYVMKAMLLQMATMRRLTMSFMPKAANTNAEATIPIVLLFVTIATIALSVMTAPCITTGSRLHPVSEQRWSTVQ